MRSRNFLALGASLALLSPAAQAQTSPLAASGPLALLSPFTPQSAPSRDAQELRLFALTNTGVLTSAFNTVSRTWTAPIETLYGSTAQADKNLLGFSYLNVPNFAADYQTVFAWNSVQGTVFADGYFIPSLVPPVSSPLLNIRTVSAPWSLSPQSLLSHRSSTREYNIFGLDRSNKPLCLPTNTLSIPGFTPPLPRMLREAFVTSGGTSFTQHGNVFSGSSSQMLLGSRGSAMLATQAVVATTSVASDSFSAVPQVVCRVYTPSTGWFWQSLGTPPGVTRLRAPLAAIQVYNTQGDIYWERLSLYVVGLVTGGGTQPWHVFRIEQDANGTWGSWVDYGAPTGLGTSGGINGVPAGYELTAATDRGTRVQLAGQSDSGDRIVHFTYDSFANRAQWEPSHFLPASRSTAKLALGSLTSLSYGNWGISFTGRLSFFVRLNNGEVWERFNDTLQGAGWLWERRF